MNYSAAPDLLNNNVILVTGAGNGIGASVAKSYARHGASVILLDKNVPALEQVYDDITVDGVAVTPAIYPLDLKGAAVSDYRDLAENIHKNFGRLDGLVHCAATLGQLAPVQHQDPKIWLETVHINLAAPYLLTHACLPLMQKYEHASIIFTTDNHKDKAYWSGYGISKAGIESFSKQLADELECDGRVRVNCIDPGTVQTELHTRAFPAIDPTPLPKPDDVVAVYLYLMGKDSLKINGELISAQ
ncbi:MAG: SDR family NAD(P)-dependent oxidoreductase [Gammaproteobacteria bacterium]|nr:SDR family NAD(P)-dependent oxidoreductase [Gammaproteobacteria bacterium]